MNRLNLNFMPTRPKTGDFPDDEQNDDFEEDGDVLDEEQDTAGSMHDTKVDRAGDLALPQHPYRAIAVQDGEVSIDAVLAAFGTLKRPGCSDVDRDLYGLQHALSDVIKCDPSVGIVVAVRSELQFFLGHNFIKGITELMRNENLTLPYYFIERKLEIIFKLLFICFWPFYICLEVQGLFAHRADFQELQKKYPHVDLQKIFEALYGLYRFQRSLLAESIDGGLEITEKNMQQVQYFRFLIAHATQIVLGQAGLDGAKLGRPGEVFEIDWKTYLPRKIDFHQEPDSRAKLLPESKIPKDDH